MGRGIWGGALVGGALGAAAAVAGVALLDVPGTACASVLGQGRATHYELRRGGNCGYFGPPADGLYAALGPAEYRAAAACGGYLDVKGPDGSVRVKVVDQCPKCGPGDLDLSKAAFARIAPLSRGVVPVTYTEAVDPPVPALSVVVRGGSSAYWLSLGVIDHGNPVARVRASAAGRSWQALRQTDYNAWQAPRGLGPGPFTVEITDVRGHRALVRGIRLAVWAVQPTGVAMYGRPAADAGASATPAPARPVPARAACRE